MLIKLIKNNKFLLIFIFVHLIFFGINYSEWGDSYRILRASEFIRNLTYPEDEKRQPLYSLLLALRPGSVDQIFWGRFIMFWISILSFLVFTKILSLYNLDNRTKNIALVLLIFNPVLLYWSIRIMADMFFTLIVLLTFYVYQRYKYVLNNKILFLLGFLASLGILIRFEGYILAFCIGIGFIYDRYINKEKAIDIAKMYIVYGAGIFIFVFPWLIYRNPLTSKYFDEPSGRKYDLEMLAIYINSLLYIFGFTSAGIFLSGEVKKIKNVLLKNPAIFLFVILELILALVWPAAIPRLLVPIIPFMIITVSITVTKFFANSIKIKMKEVAVLLLLLILYISSQYLLKLQFLVPIKNFFILIIFIQFFNIYAIYKKRFNLFFVSLIFSTVIWSFSTIYLHKDIFKAIVEANIYIVKNINGKIAYNDVSSVSDWYMNQKSQKDNITGFYLNMDSKKNRSYDTLLKRNADYILITNEHNPDLEFDVVEGGYLSQVKEFSYTIRGKKFFTKIVKFNK
ncbi:hypothetical protein A2V49_00155 [candidate division WWE3 bacterium RBG_19FT_COMBO_34_6]|uniref:Glycosyltransferase RgtA/B/C/D-like domain-containing protein n=1 Tax=candidate division WWE3 bacterium RBG_19FT_COMBO_34_6 TaxID=1802612 RepID=A0A1F4UJP4_UNCKA|nr:MAG: hypothetical protein A2V49_00155 [candidate division WWE3 bacterium RBG_19FT_COMBO_34_6]